MIRCGTRKGKLYYLDLSPYRLNTLAQVDVAKNFIPPSDIWLWHRHLGYVSFGYLKQLFPKLFSESSPSLFKCETCELAKSHRVTYLTSLNKSSLPFMLINSDVWGPAKIPTINGSRWFVSFIDDYTRMTWICLMKNKQEVCSLFKQFYLMVTTQYQSSIRILRTDNIGEFINHNLKNFVKMHGIIHQTTCPYSPQQNSVAEW